MLNNNTTAFNRKKDITVLSKLRMCLGLIPGGTYHASIALELHNHKKVVDITAQNVKQQKPDTGWLCSNHNYTPSPIIAYIIS